MANFVSVIIPTYNREKILEICLDSVLNQTYKDYEVIVVDNNSIDNTKQIIKEFEKKDRKIKYVFESERKRGSARNTGEMVAKGEIILMTDDDCIVSKNWIEKMIEPIVKESCDAVQGFQEPIIHNFWTNQIQTAHIEKFGNMGKEIIGFIDTKNFAVKYDVLKKIGFTNRKYLSGNDIYLSIKLFQYNFKFKFLKNVKVKHFHPDSFAIVAKKSFYKAFWVSQLVRDYKDIIEKTEFFHNQNFTFWHFIELFPGVFSLIFKQKKPKKAFFELFTGLIWRAGQIYGRIRKI